MRLPIELWKQTFAKVNSRRSLSKNRNRLAAAYSFLSPELELLEPRQMLSAVVPSNENLLENGSFEDDNLEEINKVKHGKNGLWKYFRNGITDWGLETKGSVEIQRNYHSDGAEGAQHVELDSNRSVAISQTIDTVAGHNYVLRLAHKKRPGTNAANNKLGIHVESIENSEPSETLLNKTITDSPDDWTYYTYTFTATTDKTDSFRQRHQQQTRYFCG